MDLDQEKLTTLFNQIDVAIWNAKTADLKVNRTLVLGDSEDAKNHRVHLMDALTATIGTPISTEQRAAQSYSWYEDTNEFLKYSAMLVGRGPGSGL